MKLSNKDFLKIIHLTPLVSIDLIIKNKQGEILLGERNNKPAQGFWFVPGGRILKNETIKIAYQRILKNETGLEVPFEKATLLGVYDHIYDDNFLGDPTINTQYVVLAFIIELADNEQIITDDQHSQTIWCGITDLISSQKVHINTKRYFTD